MNVEKTEWKTLMADGRNIIEKLKYLIYERGIVMDLQFNLKSQVARNRILIEFYEDYPDSNHGILQTITHDVDRAEHYLTTTIDVDEGIEILERLSKYK